jgi:bifunctional DNA-binding transcriptional regulator/antitoxin component of YhaV-PrlF toxin-antitoxin module
MRTARVGQHRELVLPRAILKTLNLQEGDVVAFAEQKNGVLIKPKRTLNPDDTLSAAEAKKVRQGMKQIKEGRFKLWRDVKHELGR